MRRVKLTDSESWSMWTVSPPSSSSSPHFTAAVQRGHVALLAVIDASTLAAAHLADGRREHHLEPLCPSSSSSSCLSINQMGGEGGQEQKPELQLQHVDGRLLHGQKLQTYPPLPCSVIEWKQEKKKGGRRKRPAPPPPPRFSAKLSWVWASRARERWRDNWKQCAALGWPPN